MTEAIYQDVVKAFGEDRAIIEAQQRRLTVDPQFRAAATVHDKGLNQARFILQQRLAAEARTDDAGAASGELQSTPRIDSRQAPS